ncbi:MAG: sensor histidine kinase [Bacteroidota bacterium]|nr:sensor histidine kinase [Bacteroidota bacterium]
MARIILKHIGSVLLIMLHYTGSGQPSVMNELRKVDSLMHIEHIEEADSLLKEIEELPNISKTAQLKLQYLRGYFYNASEENTLATKALLQLPEMAEQEKQFDIAAEANIQMALVHEKTGDYKAARQHLNRAFYLLDKYHMDTLLGWYYVRNSSYYRIKGQRDSALYFANKSIPYAKKFLHQHALADAYLLRGILFWEKQPEISATNFQLALNYYSQQHNYRGISGMYNNLSKIYLNMGYTDKALLYNDSAVRLANYIYIPNNYINWFNRSNIYHQKKQYDSALFYYKQYSTDMINEYSKNEEKEIKKLTQQYEVDKKDSIIRSNKNRFLATIVIVALLTLVSLLLYLQNRKIKRQNKKINAQVSELNKLVKQKQILLSELQHRVKNNLQHVLSLLDIQEESLAHNNIQEVIRENRNRIQSMALLHSKLSYANGNDAVNFEDYLHEMAALIQVAYFHPQKKINIQVNCDIKQLDIDTGIPMGLIIVELLSNSLKHAFIKKETGTIQINITQDIQTGKRLLEYSDDGSGFDFKHPPRKGLGQELVNGLLKEINATLNTKHEHGTAFFIRF